MRDPFYKVVEPVFVPESFVPQDNDIIATCSNQLSISDLCRAFALTLRKLGHINVHVYVAEFNAAVETSNGMYASEVLNAMSQDIKLMSPPELSFGVHSFPKRGHNLHWGWRTRGDKGVYH